MIKSLNIVIALFFISGCHTFYSNNTQNSQAAESNVKLGLAFLRDGNLRSAKEKLLLAQELDQRNPAIWYSMGYFLESTGEITLAKQNYLQAIALNPKDGAAHNNYGAFLYRCGAYRESIKHFLMAVEDANYLDIGEAYENAGLSAIKIPDTKLAEIFFKKAFERNPHLFVSQSYLRGLKIE